MCSLRVRSLETATENLPQADAHPDNELSHAMTNRIGARVALLATVTCLLLMGTSFANLRKLDDVSAENLVHESKAVVSALEKVGQPLDAAELSELRSAWNSPSSIRLAELQDILNKYVLVDIWIDEEGWLRGTVPNVAPKDRLLTQGKWMYYLVRVYNQSGVKAPVEVRSPQELSAKQLEQAEAAAGTDTTDSGDWYRWIGLRKVEPPLEPMEFRTTTVRYLVLGIFSRDRGMRSATLEFYLGGGAVTQRQPLKERLLFFTQ